MFNKEEILKELYQVAKINDIFDETNNRSDKFEKEYQDLLQKEDNLKREIIELGRSSILSVEIDLSKNIEEKQKELNIVWGKLDNLETKNYNYYFYSDKLEEKKDKKIKGIEKKIKGLYHVYDEEYRNKFFAEYLSKKFNKKMEYFCYPTCDIEKYSRSENFIKIEIISTEKICNILKKFNYKFSVKEIHEFEEKMCKDKNNILNNEFIFPKFFGFSNIFSMNTKELNQNKELLNVLLDYYQLNSYNKHCSYEKE